MDLDEMVQGKEHIGLCRTRKRKSLFSGRFANGIPGGKRSRDFILSDSSSTDESSTISDDEPLTDRRADRPTDRLVIYSDTGSDTEGDDMSTTLSDDEPRRGADRPTGGLVIYSDTGSDTEGDDTSTTLSDDETLSGSVVQDDEEEEAGSDGSKHLSPSHTGIENATPAATVAPKHNFIYSDTESETETHETVITSRESVLQSKCWVSDTDTESNGYLSAVESPSGITVVIETDSDEIGPCHETSAPQAFETITSVKGRTDVTTTGTSKLNTDMPSTANTAIILMSLRPREEYHKAAEQKGMCVLKLDPPDVIKTITGPKILSAVNKALHEGYLNLLKRAKKGTPILLDISPIRTIAVEGRYGQAVGELEASDMNGYMDEWEKKWLPVLQGAGYKKIVVLADVADVDITAKVAEQQGKATKAGFCGRQMSPAKKLGYLHAIADYHSEMLGLTSVTPCQSYRQKVLDAYGFEYTCFLANEDDTPSTALDKALQ